MFRERGVEVSVGEIADAAGVGRGTLFRNFKNKDELIAAVCRRASREVMEFGRQLLEHDPDDAEVRSRSSTGLVERQEENRALLQSVTDELFMAVPELNRAHAAMMELMGALLARGKRVGAIRPEATRYRHDDADQGAVHVHAPTDQPLPPETIVRHLDLVRAALSTPEYSRPLGGQPRAAYPSSSA